MKSNKRYLLVALALLLATLLISGLALADDTTAVKPTVKSIKFNATSYSANLPSSKEVDLYFSPSITEDDPEENEYGFTVETADLPEGESVYNYFRFALTTSNKNASDVYGTWLTGTDVDTTEITVRAYDKETGKLLKESEKVKVTFKEISVTDLIYNDSLGTPLEIGLGDEGYMSNLGRPVVTILPETATYGNVNTDLTWSVDKTDILRLGTNGAFKALKVGEAKVTVTSKSASKKSCTIDVKVVVSEAISDADISFTPNSFSLNDDDESVWLFHYFDMPNEKYNLDMWGNITDIACKKVRWTSSDDAIAWIDSDSTNPFYWYAHAGSTSGTATLTLTITNYDGTTASTSITVTVDRKSITGLKFRKEEYTTPDNEYDENIDLQGELIITPDDTWVYYKDQYDLIWSSDDESVAKIKLQYAPDGYGNYYVDKAIVIAGKPGTATITVKCKHDETITATTKIVVKNKTVSKVKMPETLEVSYASSTPERIEFTFEPYDAYIEDVTWVSSDATVIQLQDETNSYGNGKGYTYIYTKKAGTATVTVKVNDGTSVHEASCVVTVKKENASTLKLNKKKVTLYLHKSASDNRNVEQLYAYDKNKRYGDEDVTWSSSKKSVVSVDRQGNLTVHGKGKATITATTKDGTGLTAKCTVEVKKENLKSISGNKKITLRVGQRATLSDLYYSEMITFSPSLDKVYDDELIFKSSNRNIVSVNKKTGTLVANSVGTAEITVTSKANKKVTFTFKVKVIDAVQ